MSDIPATAGDPAPQIVRGCELVDLPLVHDARGNLTFVEADRHAPFEIRRVYYLYDVPAGERRAGHAHYELQQLVVAVTGSFDVLLDDGTDRRIVPLSRGDQGLLMRGRVWREIGNFSAGAVCLVLASRHYDEADYIRDYDDFLAHVGATRAPETEVIRDESGSYTIVDPGRWASTEIRHPAPGARGD